MRDRPQPESLDRTVDRFVVLSTQAPESAHVGSAPHLDEFTDRKRPLQGLCLGHKRQHLGPRARRKLRHRNALEQDFANL